MRHGGQPGGIGLQENPVRGQPAEQVPEPFVPGESQGAGEGEEKPCLEKEGGVLFRAGEVGRMGVGEMVVDSSEIINTLRGGGISSVGYAISEVIDSGPVEKDRGFFDRIIGRKQIEERRPEEKLMGEDKTSRILSLVTLMERSKVW